MIVWFYWVSFLCWYWSMEEARCLKPFNAWSKVLTLKAFLWELLLLRMRVGHHDTYDYVPPRGKYPWWLVLVITIVESNWLVWWENIYIYILRWSCLLIFSSIFNLMSPFQFECLMQPASWIINSLHLGRLLPLTENKHSSPLTRIMVQELPTSMEFSAEIWNLLPLYLATRFVH